MRCCHRYLFIVLLAVPPICHAGFDPYFKVDSLFYSEPIAVKAITGNWHAPLHSGDTAFTTDKIEIGIAWDGWSIGTLYRYDYFFNFTPETAELVHSSKNKIELKPGRHYSLALNANGLRTRGIKLAREIRIDQGLSVSAGVSLLEGVKFINGGISGNAVATAVKDYDVNFQVDYTYSKDTLFDRIATPPKGKGYSLDLDANWQPTRSLKVSLAWLDLLGMVKWFDAPFTKATGNTDNKAYDENGYVIYNPVVTGIESNRDYKQRIPRKFFLESSYHYTKQSSFQLKYQDYGIEDFFYAGIGWETANDLKLKLLYCAEVGTIDIGFAMPNFSIALISDDTNINAARVFGLRLSYLTQF
jgi:hypothetical protein